MLRNHPAPPPAKTEQFEFHPWTLTTTKSHILPSKCCSNPHCSENSSTPICRKCYYDQNLKIPHLPDMVFPDNILRIEHPHGFGIEFNALDALKMVSDQEDTVKVAVANVWKEARSEVDVSHEVSHPFDWTFTSEYRGTILGNMKVTETDMRIDMTKLKQKEKILFFDEVHLYEDELADHGCTSCSIKLRAMPSGFFALHRFYLRVDDVLIRINDTRIYYEKGNNYILREYTSRASEAKDLKVPRVFWGDPNEISQHLPLITGIYEKLEF